MKKILLVEDSKTTREIISNLLTKQGLLVQSVTNGEDALTIMKSTIPDLVILDIILPKMNGYEVCRHIKSEQKTQNVPVILCSSKKEEFDRYWGMKQGADAYISKPFQASELMKMIKQLLRK
ncbi:two component signal transduction system twitching motility response regulator PilH [Cyanobacterium sp. HL-69]|uniref:response regulator transcription factor n=1 Tax=unclassified Cyanobacterium TaxID=2629879 RepID=UPI0008524752|nr:response regulator [Cyanobacterium sp. IPPAS B-1200]AUC59745.1 two component signal transduction system twitching motility response regulator PilH [Cyanobacterium sp. HL-69]OEJ79969.1 two-component system response regulator [Cyanobacterium sp. IPPAS B-1200]